MELYKVLLVDDEEEARRAIVKKLDWEALGFQMAGEASNGEEALELAERLAPDVIMTDIRMPFMDGLTLCRRAKQLLPGVHLAIFSGYDDFEYAKEAIHLEVEEYILKPIDAEELADIFRRLRRSLDREIAESQNIEQLRRYYRESLPLMRQQLLMGLLEGRMEAHRIESSLREYELDLTAGAWCVAAVQIHPPESAAYQGNDPLLGVSLRQIIAEALPSKPAWHLAPLPDKTLLLFLLDAPGEVRAVTTRLNALFPLVYKRLGTRLSVGVGNAVTSLEDLHISHADADSALEYQVLVEPGQCVYIGDIEPVAASPAGWDTRCIDDILRQIKIGRRQDLEMVVGAMIASLKQSHASLQQYQYLMLGIATELLRLIRAYRLDEKDARVGDELLERALSRFSALDEMGRWLFEYCDKIRGMIRAERKDSAHTLVDQAIAYMDAHFADSDLSVEQLAGELGVSPAYFSTLFKKETGGGFVGHLTTLRMEKALEYLNTTDDKTYQIAEKIGYTDPNYFSYVFKKQFGVSPSKYRQTGLRDA